MSLRSLYSNFFLTFPKIILFILICFVLCLMYEARNLKIDASSETLILEDDKDLEYTIEVNERYYSPDYLVIAFTPKDSLFSIESLKIIKRISKELESLEMVSSVTSILNVPLLQSPIRPISDLVNFIPTMESEGIEYDLVQKEFSTSPIYKDNIVSPDFKTTALLVNLTEDFRKKELRDKRNHLRSKLKNVGLSSGELVEFELVKRQYKLHRDKIRSAENKTISDIRNIIQDNKGNSELFLGGLMMITDDVISFIKNDLKIFGLSILIFLIITLSVIFRQIRWIILPILTCSISVICTAGILGFFGWEVTVISSNFISLQLIITMAITIHLIVRYRELVRIHSELNQKELILLTIERMAKPCLYAVLTTIAGFSSLIFSGLLPVINFGWMMSAGVTVSLIMTFLLFPLLQINLDKLVPNTKFEDRFSLPNTFAIFTDNNGKTILYASFIVLIFCVLGASRLRVENSFIDYFKNSTEIYKGMKVIDQQLGGTTALDVTLDFTDIDINELDNQETFLSEEEDDELDDLMAELDELEQEPQYWFTRDKMEKVERVHDYLDSLPETGKVSSLGTLLKVGRILNDNQSLDSLQLGLLYNEIPEKYKNIILNPYVSIDDNQVRFAVRIRDSQPNLRRNDFLLKLKNNIHNDANLGSEKVRFSNMLVLYNNMLQSLYKSQILTLGAVIMALFIMFLILFKSFTISIIALVPNLLSIGSVLGFMGWFNIPLDMMTITIAAISMGIAVDNTIHYIHRFKAEFSKDFDYIKSMYRAHTSIGYAMYYTSLIIIIGFSILVFSNFIPSIYFGLLTGLAMLVALIASLTLLPRLIVYIKPFKPLVAADQ